MQSHRKSKNSSAGDHSEKNPLRSNTLNTNVARKPARIGNPSRLRGDPDIEDGQTIELAGKNLQEETPAERAAHSRTAEILSAPVVLRSV